MSGGAGISDGRSYAAGESLVFPNTNAEDDATRKPRRSIFIVDGFERMEICGEFLTLSRKSGQIRPGNPAHQPLNWISFEQGQQPPDAHRSYSTVAIRLSCRQDNFAAE